MSQTISEKQAVLTAWEESQWFPRNPLLLLTDNNIKRLQDKVMQRDISISDVVEIVSELTKRNLLEYAQKPPEKIIVEVERKKTPDEIAREKREKFERSHAAGLVSGNRNELDDPAWNKPVLPENSDELARIAAADLRENQIANDTLARIDAYTGRTHARTQKTRTILREMFHKLKTRMPMEQIQKRIEQKMGELDGDSSVR
jgi:hypothetical protein